MADEQKKQEAEAAAAQINEILSQSRPKNAVAGVGNGVSNIVAGAVGAVGVIILAPTIGAAAGTKSGGIVGGVVGLTGGAVVGVIGGAALAVGGMYVVLYRIVPYCTVMYFRYYCSTPHTHSLTHSPSFTQVLSRVSRKWYAVLSILPKP
jgi:CBS domain containing-hemolysin-like protein